MDVSEKNHAEKNACWRCFWLKMKSWWGEDTGQNSASTLNLLNFAVGWALCGRPQPEHESTMPLLPLSLLNAFNPLKLYSLSW